MIWQPGQYKERLSQIKYSRHDEWLIENFILKIRALFLRASQKSLAEKNNYMERKLKRKLDKKKFDRSFRLRLSKYTSTIDLIIQDYADGTLIPFFNKAEEEYLGDQNLFNWTSLEITRKHHKFIQTRTKVLIDLRKELWSILQLTEIEQFRIALDEWNPEMDKLLP